MTKPLRVHVLGIPHTATSPLFAACAFTQKVRKLIHLLADEPEGASPRYEVVHYGCDHSTVHPRAEHVSVTSMGTLVRAYGHEYWQRFFRYHQDDAPNREFRENAIREMRSRVRPRDVILASWGVGHEPVTREFPEAIVVEPGIGYPAGSIFAPHKVFESYAYMHYCYGKLGVVNPSWYDAVIPNWFDLSDFDFAPERKQDYLLFIGRIQEDKGLPLYVKLAEQLGFKLLVGGQGSLASMGIKPPGNVVEVGYCDPDKRRRLMAEARGFLLASYYVEPFGGAAVEAMISGTPVIAADHGVFNETVLHGLTGYRCRTLDQFVWAVRNLARISPEACRAWATENYSLAKARVMFDEYLDMLHRRYADPRGWDARDPKRGPVVWLERSYPSVETREPHVAVLEAPTEAPVAVVTALHDTGREAIDGRPFRDYLSWFERTLALDVPMVVYVAPTLERFVRDARGRRPTRVVLEEAPPVSERLEEIQRVLDLPDREVAHPTSVENRSARYLAAIWSKPVWMRQAADERPFGARGLVWLDAGISRFFGRMDLSAPWPHPSLVDALTGPRIVVEGRGEMRDALEGRRRLDPHVLVGTAECLLPMGCWGGGVNAVRSFSSALLGVLDEMLASGRVDNEQVGAAIAWTRAPALLDVWLRPEDAREWIDLPSRLAGFHG